MYISKRIFRTGAWNRSGSGQGLAMEGMCFHALINISVMGDCKERRESMRHQRLLCKFESLNCDRVILNDLVPSEAAGWMNYPRELWTFEKRGYKLTNGLDILIYKIFPNGSGFLHLHRWFHRSALRICLHLTTCDGWDPFQIGQYSENNFNGTFGQNGELWISVCKLDGKERYFISWIQYTAQWWLYMYTRSCA